MVLTSTCMIQEGTISDAQRSELEAALKDAVRRHVGRDARLAVAWLTVPHGSGYSAGKPSSTSLVQVAVPDGFEQDKRAALMHDVNDRWCQITGHTRFQLLLGATDKTPGRAVVKAMLDQIPLKQKPRFLANYVPQALLSLARG